MPLCATRVYTHQHICIKQSRCAHGMELILCGGLAYRGRVNAYIPVTPLVRTFPWCVHPGALPRDSRATLGGCCSRRASGNILGRALRALKSREGFPRCHK